MFATRAILALFAAALAVSVQAAPLGRRQIGDLTCNIDRLKIVLAMKSTTSDVNALASLAGITGDATNAAAVQSAQSGISSAQDGINTIGKALVSLQSAPPAARIQVQSGLNATQAALTGISSNDTSVIEAVAKAQDSLTNAITAGDGVVSNCK